MEKLLINTERLQIRNLKTTDLEDFHKYRSNPEVTQYQGFDVMTLEQASLFIQNQQSKLFGQPGEWLQLGIENILTQKLTGDCAIKLDIHDIRNAEIGITISHIHQKQGYAKEAMSAMMDFLFGLKNVHRIVETVDTENIASVALMESLGFRQEAYLIENNFIKGKWASEIQFAMLEREWHQSVLKNQRR